MPQKYLPWGKSVSIDLFDCDLSLISDPESIRKFVQSIVSEIHMVAHGPCLVERFGCDDLEGYSAIQFIETSSITVHCDEPGRRAFIDIFSCKNFDDQAAVNYSRKYFKAQSVKSTPLNR
jgi:S-adenosylmethionine/arginine decarboxylase-like enzyme